MASNEQKKIFKSKINNFWTKDKDIQLIMQNDLILFSYLINGSSGSLPFR